MGVYLSSQLPAPPVHVTAGRPKLAKISPPDGNINPNLAAACEILDAMLHAKLDIEGKVRARVLAAGHTTFVEGQGVLAGGWIKRGGINRPDLQFLPNEHVLWDPYALCDDEITFFIRELWLSDEELWQRQQAGLYKNVAQVIGGSEEASTGEWRKEITTPSNQKRKMYKILEYWGPQQLVPLDQLERKHQVGGHTAEEDIVATVYKNRVLLRVQRNPWAKLYKNPTPYERLPFWIMRAAPKVNSTYGWSTAEWIRPLQREINKTRNQRRQAVDMEMAAKIFYDETRGINLKALLSSRYGGAVGTAGPPGDVVNWFVPRTTTGNMAQEEALMDQEIQDITGVTSLHFGTPAPAQTRTATAAQLVTTEGNVKLDTLLKNMVDTGIIPMVEFFAAAALKYMTPKEIQQIIQSPTPPPHLREVIKRDYNVQVESGVSATSKAAELRNLNTAIMANAQAANFAPNEALAALRLLLAKQLRLLGFGDVAGFYDMVGQGMGQGQAPAGYGQRALPSAEAMQAGAMQGGLQLPEQTRRVA